MKKFDRVFKHYDKFIELFNLNKMDEIKDVLELQGDEVVLDIGGGTGRLADYLSKNCQIVYVLDESKGMLSKVKANTKVLPILGNALDTIFDSNSADVVIMSDVLHHIKDQKKLIEEIYRILKKDGKLIILDFEKKHIKIRILRVFEYILFGKLYFRTSKEVINLIKDKLTITKFIDKKYYFIIRGEKNA
ncbi:MAG: class I SAM-dependent methyltransferase [Tissierellia bacterium]|nr:class I SAM-dependent methyltransferase [Tissierellia bacterium]